MPDQATSTPAGAPAATPAASVPATDPGTAQPSPNLDDNPGGLEARHWQDPDLGPRLKNWKKWADEKGTLAKTAEERAANLERQMQEMAGLLNRFPKLKGQLLQAYSGTYREQDDATPPSDETPEQRLRREVMSDVTSAIRSEMATNAHIISLGKGNFSEGEKLFNAQKPQISDVLRIMNEGDPMARLSLATELLRLRQAPPPTPTTTPPPVPPTEPGRGTPSSTPANQPTNDQERLLAVMAAAGYGGPDGLAQYMRDNGSFGA